MSSLDLVGIGLCLFNTGYYMPRALVAFFATSRTCVVNVRFLSNVTPRCLGLFGPWWPLITICFKSVVLVWLKSSATVFWTLIRSRHLLNQVVAVSIWCCSWIIVIFTFCWCVEKSVSSANRDTPALWFTGTSLEYDVKYILRY